MKAVLFFLLILIGYEALAQANPGLVIGSVTDEKGKPLEGCTVQLSRLQDSLSRAQVTQPDGSFSFTSLPLGYYRIRFSYIGLQTLTLDSVYLRAERYDFNLNEIVLKANTEKENLDAVIIYAEKPLVQSKDGNITFNAGESALSAGSNASDLLTNVPLVTKDPTGKLMVRGKEPKVLIDDKPVELNQQQLQDLLESMPGSSIEKIEVMTNPPPQYAGEQGGVINIVTRKGTVGLNGRVSVYGGSRGEGGLNGSLNYRKQGFTLNINAGAGYGAYEGEGYSNRQNIYTDSTNYFNTQSSYINKALRPNLRVNLNYDPDKFHSFNLVLFYNGNDFTNRNLTSYRNLNKNGDLYRYSERSIRSTGVNHNPNATVSYTLRTKRQGESLRLISSVGLSPSWNTRDFYQQFLNPDGTPNGYDSTQQQQTDNYSKSYNVRLSYDLPFDNRKTSVSLGSYYNLSQSDIEASAGYLRKSDSTWADIDALANDFRFSQYITNFRASVKQLLSENFSTTIGMNAEQTTIRFDLYKTNEEAGNHYWSFLPFATISRNWKDRINLSFSYRRTIRRPGINSLNPTIDFSDPYNIRYGNPTLLPSPSHNFDLVLGKSKQAYYINFGMGYNLVDDIFAQVRTLQDDGKTHTTWENISGRREYEVSTWSGYTVSRKMKVNLSASYTYNRYSEFDKTVRKYRDGGSITSNLNSTYTLKDLYSATGSFTFNRFANPQGTVSSTLSMNIGLQARLLKKKLTATLNIIDPFIQQQNRSYTYGRNFAVESFNTTRTRNFRLSLGYSFSRKPKKTSTRSRQELNKALQKVKAGS